MTSEFIVGIQRLFRRNSGLLGVSIGDRAYCPGQRSATHHDKLTFPDRSDGAAERHRQ